MILRRKGGEPEKFHGLTDTESDHHFFLASALALSVEGCGHISGYLGFLHRHRSLEKDFQNQPRIQREEREKAKEGVKKEAGKK